MTYVEKQVLLQSLDHLWREHLVTLDHLRQVIGWRGYAQRDPLNEYKSEAFDLFNELVGHLREQVTGPADAGRGRCSRTRRSRPSLPPMFARAPRPGDGRERVRRRATAPALRRRRPGARATRRTALAGDLAVLERDPDDPATWGRVGRNELCPCGSGKKYKHCHGRSRLTPARSPDGRGEAPQVFTPPYIPPAPIRRSPP